MLRSVCVCCAILISLSGWADVYSGGSFAARFGETEHDKFFSKWDLMLHSEWTSTSDRFSISAKARGIYLHEPETGDARVEKGLITWRPGQHLEIFAGRTAEIWGRLDELTALDFPFADDFRWRYWEAPEDRKLARWVLGQKSFWGNQSLTVMIFPEAQLHEIEQAEGGWCDQVCQWSHLDIQMQTFRNQGFNVSQGKQQGDDNPEAAMRWTGLVGNLDAGWTAYYGSDHWPRVVRQFGADNSVVLSPAVFQNWAFGLDAAYSIGDWVLRAEAAHRPDVALPLDPVTPVYALDDDGFTERNISTIAAALETTWSSGIRTNWQYLYSAVAGTEHGIIFPREAHAASLYVEKSFYDHNITVENRTVLDLEHGGYHNRLTATWSPYQGGEIALEYSTFHGDDSLRNYGYLSRNNGVYAIFRHEF